MLSDQNNSHRCPSCINFPEKRIFKKKIKTERSIVMKNMQHVKRLVGTITF